MNLDFGAALAALKNGQRIARAGWNGKGMFAYLVPANSYPAQTGAAKAHFGERGMVPYNAYMALKGADNTVSTWAPSGSDTLANDWVIVGDMFAPHQRRVVNEYTDLADKCVKLEAFLGIEFFRGLPADEQQRLRSQHEAMNTYADILSQRIAAFPKEAQ